jgi:hypothetical protein
MVKKRNKKNGNNVLYAGIVIAIIAISFLSLYTYTDLFGSRAELLPAEWSLTEPTPPEGSIVDQTTFIYDEADETIQSAVCENNVDVYCRVLAQSFQNEQEYLTGFGTVLRQTPFGDEESDCYFAIAPELPVDPYDYNNYIVEGIIPNGQIEGSAWYYVWVETPYIQLPVGQPLYFLIMSENYGLESDYETLCIYEIGGGVDYYPGGQYYWKDVGYDDEWQDFGSLPVDFMFFTWTIDEPPSGEDPTTSFSWFSLWWLWLIIVAAIIIAVVNYLRKK